MMGARTAPPKAQAPVIKLHSQLISEMSNQLIGRVAVQCAKVMLKQILAEWIARPHGLQQEQEAML